MVLAAEGYPDEPIRGTEVRGLERAASVPGVQVFHAGTEQAADGRMLAAAGRVLTVCGTAPTLREARDAAYAGVKAIDWPEGFCREDIGWRALL